MENNQRVKIDQNVAPRKVGSHIKIPKDFFEKREWSKKGLICGIDEVGRGCLAGPLVVAAVILYPDSNLKMLKDSKILTQEQLISIAPRIIKNSWYSYGIVSNTDIDKFNIWNATLIAMKKAVMNLFATCPTLPSIVLIDALPLNLSNTTYKDIEVQFFSKGESLSRSIAAASIIAKVKRDSLMGLYDDPIPNYSFSKHKGYGTTIHKESISVHGSSILHRKSYLKKFDYLLNQNKSIDIIEQINIFNQKEI